jgi:hypothetical protein
MTDKINTIVSLRMASSTKHYRAADGGQPAVIINSMLLQKCSFFSINLSANYITATLFST